MMHLERFAEALWSYDLDRELVVMREAETGAAVVSGPGVGFPPIIVPMTLKGAFQANKELTKRAQRKASDVSEPVSP